MKRKQNILKLDFGSTSTKFDFNGEQRIIDTLVPTNYNWKDKYSELDIMFEHLKKEWVTDIIKKEAVIEFFKYIHKNLLKSKKISIIYATYPTHFNVEEKSKYIKVLKDSFDTNQVYLTSEANALVYGAKATYLDNVTIMDIGGFTTDICFYKSNEVEVKTDGIKYGGEDISDKLARELYNNNFLPYYDLYTAKKIKELRFSNVKKYLEVITDILVSHQTRETKVTFSELNDFIDNLFKNHYTNLLNSINISGYDNTVILTGAIANIEAFQEIASSVLSNPVFESNPFILLDGLEKVDYKEILEDDLYIAGKVGGEDHYRVLARKGTALPFKSSFNCWLTGNDIKIVTLKPDSYHKGNNDLNKNCVSNVKVWGTLSHNYKISDRVNKFEIEIHLDKVNLVIQEKTSAFDIEYTKDDIELIENAEELAAIEFEKAKQLRHSKLLHSYDVLLQRINSFKCSKEDKDLILTIVKELKMVAENPTGKYNFTYPMANIKEEEICKINTFEEFCLAIESSYISQYSYQPLMNFVNKTIYKEERKLFLFKKTVLNSDNFNKMRSICNYYLLLCNYASDDLLRKGQIQNDKETIHIVMNLMNIAELNSSSKN